MDEAKSKDDMDEAKKDDMDEAKKDDMDEAKKEDMDEEMKNRKDMDEMAHAKKDDMDEAKKDDMDEEMSRKKSTYEDKSELNEAIEVIKTLKSELNEVNLLNAKLLYVNKLFRNKTLTEAQKVKVINAFDRAESVKEVKNIFETIKDAITSESKKSIQENRGFASKAAGVSTKKQPIVEGDDFVSRMQKLAGIIN
jgi:aspartate oxidase